MCDGWIMSEVAQHMTRGQRSRGEIILFFSSCYYFEKFIVPKNLLEDVLYIR